MRKIKQTKAHRQERKFQATLDHLEGRVVRMRIRVEPHGMVFLCRARLWQEEGNTVIIRAKGNSECKAISAAAEAMERKLRRSRERTRERGRVH